MLVKNSYKLSTVVKLEPFKYSHIQVLAEIGRRNKGSLKKTFKNVESCVLESDCRSKITRNFPSQNSSSFFSSFSLIFTFSFFPTIDENEFFSLGSISTKGITSENLIKREKSLERFEISHFETRCSANNGWP